MKQPDKVPKDSQKETQAAEPLPFRLTPAEIESLKADARAASKRCKELIAAGKAAGKF